MGSPLVCAFLVGSIALLIAAVLLTAALGRLQAKIVELLNCFTCRTRRQRSAPQNP